MVTVWRTLSAGAGAFAMAGEVRALATAALAAEARARVLMTLDDDVNTARLPIEDPTIAFNDALIKFRSVRQGISTILVN